MKSPQFYLTALLSLAAANSLWAVPTQIAQESFEGTGGSIGFTTSVPQFIELATSPFTDYFSIIPNNGTKVGAGRTLPGADGANIFGAEDCDTSRTTPAVQGPQEVTLTTNSVSIAGKINTQVRLLMAAPGRQDTAGGSVDLNQYENFSNAPLFINKLKVEASIDGGAFQRIVQFSPNVTQISTQLTFDADGNNVGGDANPIPTNPTTLDDTLREGIYSIPTGNTVQIRVTLESDATGELICFDNIRIFGESTATNPPVLAGVPGANLTFTEGSSATAIAPAITVADSDSANLTSASVVISTGLTSAEDVLAATPSGALLPGNIVYTAGTGTLAITGAASLADYQAVLRSVTYRNTNNLNPTTNVRRVTFLANDGTNPSNSPIRDINVIDNIVTQSIPFVESWETDGRGTRYSVDGGFSLPPSMFARVQPGAVGGLDGTFAFGVENVDDNSDFTELVTFNLNSAGLVGLTGELRVAAGGGAVYDNNATVPDFLQVEVSADGGAFTKVLAFYPDAAAQGNMRQDTTPNDATNLGDGTLLTAALQTFTFNLPTANVLTVRIRAFTNIVGENILFDRLAVQGTPLTFAIDSVSGGETGSRTFTVTRSSASGADTVNYATATGTAGAADFTAASGTVSFADGETTKPIAITITPDNIVELDETFTVALSSPSRGTITGGPGTGTIVNDDSAVLSMTGGSVLEGDSGTATITFNVALTNPVDVAVGFVRNTQDGTATTANSDYVAVVNGAGSIAAGNTTGNFTVTVNGDNTPEANETFQVVLSSLAAAGRNVTFTAAAATISAAGTITDDDPVIVAGAGSLSMGVGASGKFTTASLLALATGGEGRALSLVSVQATTTAGGGTVSIAGGWVTYQPAANFNGADSFTYTITDGFQTVTGTVNVIVSNGIGQTVNILGITPQGAGNQLVALGIPGRTYRWQTSSNLTTWTNLGSALVCPASGVITQTDPGPLPPTRFYRMVQP